MEVFGFIVSALNLVAIYSLTRCQNGLMICGNVKSKIKANFKWAHKELGDSIPVGSTTYAAFENSVNRLYDLHNAIQKTARAEDELRLIRVVSLSGLAIVVLSVVISFFLSPAYTSIQPVLKIVIPLGILLYEGYLLLKSMQNESALNELKAHLEEQAQSYKSLET